MIANPLAQFSSFAPYTIDNGCVPIMCKQLRNQDVMSVLVTLEYFEGLLKYPELDVCFDAIEKEGGRICVEVEIII